MTSTTVRIPTPLRSFTDGADEVHLDGATVGEVLHALAARHEGLAERILDERGELRRFVNVFVDAADVRSLEGLDTPLRDGAVLSIVPAVAGGMKARDRRLAELKEHIPEVTPAEALAAQKEGAVLIDVREPDEVAAGSPAGAQRLVRGFLELRVEDAVADPETPLLVLCAGGVRSLFAAGDLRQLGYQNVRSVAGGFNRWKSDGLPVEVPRTLDAAGRERYGRHLLMPEVGEEGQLRLAEGSVLLIGAGGLGCPAAYYLAAAGVGRIGIVDDDVVDRSNLQRQILHTDERVGTSKVESARKTLLGLNPSIEFQGFETRLTSRNVEEILSGWDVVVDGSDNFPTRYLVNDACVKLRLPNVHGSIFRFEGQVSVFWPHRPDSPGGRGPCYRCLYPEPPPPELAPSCAEAGVLGVLPGIVGTLEALETIKILLGIGDLLVGRLLHFDALRQRFSEFRLEPDPDCAWCGEGRDFPGYVDYEAFCSTGSRGPGP